MADDSTRNILGEAMKWIAGSGVGAALGVIAKGFFTGATGQEKEMRVALAERLSTVEAKVDALEKRLDTVTRNRDEWRWKCYEARSKVEAYATKAGDPSPTWVDPVEIST